MIEFIQLMGLKRILFLAGLVLYIVVVFIVLCSDPSSMSHTVTDDCVEHDEEESLFQEDAPYTTLSSTPEPKSAGTLRSIFRKKAKEDDLWYL